ncbi:4Fe-4S dicluster domain-containing protein [Methylomagnum ishizawai]|uniref:4Fe-4S dicluster domain-containing protein n=1 Tax=Methylomagnum ishizawai TaxID=1760988 RepID=UPI001C3343A4|nr:4Fe-4S dicluster domain-containing protein [Methylomagnum ishizawai]BBL75808.1 molybdopterin oxidoreductase [Methylomagnum ishizawai]
MKTTAPYQPLPAGPDLWRGLEGQGAAFLDFAERGFPDAAALWDQPVRRRRMLELMGASLLLGGLAGCGRPPREEIVPYVREPEREVPGRPRYYATALSHAGYAQGVLVESHAGRPTKVEGNPAHPASLGATDIFAQAAVWGLYDPDRSASVLRRGRPASFQDFAADWAARSVRRGAGLYLLTETVTSPTLAGQIDAWLSAYPEARWVQYETVGRDNPAAGTRLAFGREADTLYRFERAKVVVSLDGDFLTGTPARTRYGHDFIAARRAGIGTGQRPRLYALESCPNLVGAMADRRWPLRVGQMEAVARDLAWRLGLAGIAGAGGAPLPAAALDTLVRELQAHPGAGIVVAGDHLPPTVHALAEAINARLGNIGGTVSHIEPVAARAGGVGLAQLVDEMRGGRVQALFILGANPVYSAPVDLEFAAALAQVPFRVHHGLYRDETAALCDWHLPATHELESWTDTRAYDGTVSLVQPLIAPLYGGHSAHELMGLLSGRPGLADYEAVRGHWRDRQAGPDFEDFWRGALRAGVVPATASAVLDLALRPDFTDDLAPPSIPPAGLEIRFRPDPHLYDGRYANNGWLQELPRPLTKLVWENAALLGPGTAERLRLVSGDRVELVYQGRRVAIPVWVVPGHAEDGVTLELGYGRERAGALGDGTGVSAYRLRTRASPAFDAGLELRPAARAGGWEGLGLGQDGKPATTQHHGDLEGRDLVWVVRADAGSAMPSRPAAASASLFPPYRYDGHAWAMVIDLDACIGCNACAMACQAENNVPIVGKDEVRRGREMHWLRIDRYYAGPPAHPKTYFQPVPCMHCEQAPCEPVCPVQASIHDSEGLNNQVYNRCVGTRFCQSNCPYKVRRFNFFGYAAREATHEGAPITAALRNPDVTVRSRGVMEKCTYCVQRINQARIQAGLEDRDIREGEIVTACQQACPTQAIVFGDLNRPDSAVNAWKRDPRHYVLLEELGTRPRTTYLARVEVDDAVP